TEDEYEMQEFVASLLFFLDDTPTTEVYTLSLHDALPISAVIAYYVHPVNIQTACLIMEGAEFTENIINGVERPVKAAELFDAIKDRKSGSAGMPRPISYAVFCLKKKTTSL